MEINPTWNNIAPISPAVPFLSLSFVILLAILRIVIKTKMAPKR